MNAQIDAAILVFARAPVPGKVKTRLIPALGAEGAAALHCSLVEAVLRAAHQTAAARRELWCAPDASHAFFSACRSRFGVTLHDQADGDLGQRMDSAFRDALGRCGRAVLTGSDIPALSAGYLARAIAVLDRADVVFGPAEDGGYVLVGLTKPAPLLFRDIAWGSTEVMSQTRARVSQLGMSWRELEPLWDVDRPDDLARVRR
jgi:rSAM/selenodomain-associated transferase 1